jgi:putative phosphoesterase
MRIGILADSHDHVDNIKKVVARCREEGVEAVLHAGDFVAPFAIKALSGFDCPVHAVFGNNDGERLGIVATFGTWGKVQPGPIELELAGRRILLMHEPYGLASHEAGGRNDLIIYGHTHESEWRPQAGDPDKLVINPGEVCGWVTGRATFVLFDLAAWEGELIAID